MLRFLLVCVMFVGTFSIHAESAVGERIAMSNAESAVGERRVLFPGMSNAESAVGERIAMSNAESAVGERKINFGGSDFLNAINKQKKNLDDVDTVVKSGYTQGRVVGADLEEDVGEGHGNKKIPLGCNWDGTSNPWGCNGSCDNGGWAEYGRTDYASEYSVPNFHEYRKTFGARCVFGEKALCCPIRKPDYLMVTDMCQDSANYNGRYNPWKMHNGKWCYKSAAGDVIYFVPQAKSKDNQAMWVVGDGWKNPFAENAQRAVKKVPFNSWPSHPVLGTEPWYTMCNGRPTPSYWTMEGYTSNGKRFETDIEVRYNTVESEVGQGGNSNGSSFGNYVFLAFAASSAFGLGYYISKKY